MTSRLAERPPVGAPVVDGDDPYSSKAHVVVLLERAAPSAWALRHLAWFTRRMRARLLVAAVVTHGRDLDDLDRANVDLAQDGVQEVTRWLVEQGVAADGQVTLARYGEKAVAASDLADRAEADLVIVLAQRASWFGVFPGSPLAHQLMRRTRRPVLVIPDRGYQPSWHRLLLRLVGTGAPEE